MQAQAHAMRTTLADNALIEIPLSGSDVAYLTSMLRAQTLACVLAGALAGAAHSAELVPGPPGAEPPLQQVTPEKPPAPRLRSSDRCYTQAINCVISERKVVGSTCWCVTPFGPSYGRVR